MELTGADKRVLRGMGNTLDPTIMIGKDGVSPSVLSAIAEAHEHRELLKIRVLDNCPLHRKEVARLLERESGSSLVQLLGRTILLFRRHPTEPKISLPSSPVMNQS